MKPEEVVFFRHSPGNENLVQDLLLAEEEHSAGLFGSLAMKLLNDLVLRPNSEFAFPSFLPLLRPA